METPIDNNVTPAAPETPVAPAEATPATSTAIETPAEIIETPSTANTEAAESSTTPPPLPLLEEEETPPSPPPPKEEEKDVPKIEDIQTEIAKLAVKDELTEEDLKPFLDKGYDKQTIELAVKGMQAEIRETTNTLYKSIGGKEEYEKIVNWANTNLSKEERVEFNSLITSGNLAAMKWALRGLQARYLTAAPSEPTLITGTSEGQPTTTPFESYRDYVDAVKDPRYGKDPEYRAEVEQRFSMSVQLGKF